MAKDVINRYIWLLEVVGAAPGITLSEINDRWMRSSLNEDKTPLPDRTFHNHRKALESVFGIDIVCDKATNSYRIDDSCDFGGDRGRRWLLNSLSVSNAVSESRDLGDRIELENMPSGQLYLSPIINAMRDGMVLQIVYHNFWKQTTKEHRIEPYMLKVFKQRWYVVGQDQDAGKVKIFALDRINEMQITDQRFILSPSSDPGSYFASCYGIVNMDDVPSEEIILKVYGGQVNYFREVPLHHTQKEAEVTPEYTIFSYWMKPTYDLRRELQFKGDEVEVLAPQHFRREIADELLKAYKLYEKK